MVLEPNGRIKFLFTRSARQSPANDADRVALFDGMAAYTGIVRLDGPGRFITTVDLSWNPAYGGEQLRLFTIVEGDGWRFGPTQNGEVTLRDVALGIDPSKVIVHKHHLGGGF
jgi:hypothetical protein